MSAPDLNALAQAVKLAPQRAQGWLELGVALDAAGELDAASACLQRVTELEPAQFEAQRRLAFVWVKRGAPERALGHYRRALALDGSQVEVVLELAAVTRVLGRLDEAVELYRRALVLDPKLVDVRNDLGAALYQQGKLDDAIATYTEAVTVDPSFALGHANLGSAQKDVGLHEEAEASYRRALELSTGDATIHGGLLFALSYHPAYGAEAILAEARKFGERHTKPLASLRKPHPNSRVIERKLRIGYLSSDFREHVSMFYLDGLFKHHDRSAVELYCYSSVFPPDAWTARYSGYAAAFRNVYGIDDAAAAELIRRDGVDILVDLSMHSGAARQLIFAHKPAPLQISWLAYVGTTGNDAIDYRVTDPHLDPPSAESPPYTERSLHLPKAFWCYDPQAAEPSVSPLPALERGHVTFGCLGNFCKVNQGVLELWARVLLAVKGSHLLLHAPPGAARDRTLAVLERAGVPRSAVGFADRVRRQQYLEAHHGVDVCLDTLPYNGLSNTLDAAWMGVPTVTLVGSTVTGRAGLCVASNLELTELVAHSAEQFVGAAQALTSDLARLSELRSGLRRRLQQSPLMDYRRFARDLEEAYRRIWRQWCSAT